MGSKHGGWSSKPFLLIYQAPYVCEREMDRQTFRKSEMETLDVSEKSRNEALSTGSFAWIVWCPRELTPSHLLP